MDELDWSARKVCLMFSGVLSVIILVSWIAYHFLLGTRFENRYFALFPHLLNQHCEEIDEQTDVSADNLEEISTLRTTDSSDLKEEINVL